MGAQPFKASDKIIFLKVVASFMMLPLSPLALLIIGDLAILGIWDAPPLLVSLPRPILVDASGACSSRLFSSPSVMRSIREGSRRCFWYLIVE